LHAGINAGQNHRLVVSLGRKREVWSERKGCTTYREGPHKVPTIEFAIQKTAATRAGSLTSNHLQFCHCPSLDGDLTQNRALRKRVFHADTLRAQPTKVRSTVTAHPQASVCRLGDCFLRPDFRAPFSLLARPDDARDPEPLARLERALDMRGPMERSSIEFAVRRLSSFTITSPARS
jgi:hypothetical protein